MRNHRIDRLPRAFSLLTIAAGFCALPLAADDANRIVLRINDEIATLHDYEARKSGEISRILADPSLASADQQELLKNVGREVMTSLFGELLLLSYAEQQGIRVSTRDVEEAMVEMQRQRGIETQQQLEQALAASGMTLDDLRTNVKRELVWNQVIGREVQAQIEIGDEEVRAYYRNNSEQFLEPEQRWLKEVIVLESSERSDGELRALASQISDRLESGAELEEIASEYQEQGLTTGVIDLGWLKSDELGDELAEAAWQLEAGKFSPPVKARGGYHLLHVAEIQEAQKRPLQEVEPAIRGRMRGQRFNKELRSFMARIEKQAYIREDIPPDAVGYRRMSEGLEIENELDIFHAPVVGQADGEAEGEAGSAGE